MSPARGVADRLMSAAAPLMDPEVSAEHQQRLRIRRHLQTVAERERRAAQRHLRKHVNALREDLGLPTVEHQMILNMTAALKEFSRHTAAAAAKMRRIQGEQP